MQNMAQLQNWHSSEGFNRDSNIVKLLNINLNVVSICVELCFSQTSNVNHDNQGLVEVQNKMTGQQYKTL